MAGSEHLLHPKLWDYGYLFTSAHTRSLRRIFPLKGRVYLDLGCGLQPYRPLYEDRDRMILAVDPDPAIRGVSIRASADDLPITTESCDVVLIFTSLQCVDDPARSLREASRVLRKGGLLVISEHQAWHCYGPWDRYRFTREGLTHLGRYAGLSVRSVLPLGSFWARTGIRLNRAILPYASSKWNRITPFLAPLLAFNNLLFGLLDRIWKLDGEAVGHIAIYEKPRGVGVS